MKTEAMCHLRKTRIGTNGSLFTTALETVAMFMNGTWELLIIRKLKMGRYHSVSGNACRFRMKNIQHLVV